MTTVEKQKEQEEKVPPRVLDKFRSEVAPALREQFGYSNEMMIPKLTKIVVNMGIGKALENKARIEHAVRELGIITGQRPVIRKARKSVAHFKLREGSTQSLSLRLKRGDCLI